MTSKLRTNTEIARRVRELAEKRERAAARASRRDRRQLSAIATNYRALADELERGARADKTKTTGEGEG